MFLLKVEADLGEHVSTNYEEQMNLIFNSLKEEIENGLNLNEIEKVIQKSINKNNVGGISKIINQFVQFKRQEIKTIRDNHINTNEVIL